jgi:hypothetical protein
MLNHFSITLKLTFEIDGRITSLTSCLPTIPSSVTGAAILTFLGIVECTKLDVVLAALKGLGALTVFSPLIQLLY